MKIKYLLLGLLTPLLFGSCFWYWQDYQSNWFTDLGVLNSWNIVSNTLCRNSNPCYAYSFSSFNQWTWYYCLSLNKNLWSATTINTYMSLWYDSTRVLSLSSYWYYPLTDWMNWYNHQSLYFDTSYGFNDFVNNNYFCFQNDLVYVNDYWKHNFSYFWLYSNPVNITTYDLELEKGL